MKKKAAVISGGASWDAFGGGTLARIDKNYDLVIGMSTGALMSPLVALREWEMLKFAYINTDNSMVYDRVWYKPYPVSKTGKLRKLPVIISLILGQNTVATTKRVKKSIDSFFTENHFNELRRQNKEVIVASQNFAQTPSRVHFFNNIDTNFEDFKDWMWCSSNLPFFSSIIKKSWRNGDDKFHVGLWGDGGFTDFVGLDQINGREFDEVDIILPRHKTVAELEGRKINGLLDNFVTSITASKYDIEFEFALKRIKKLNKEGVTVNVYWLPRKLSDNLISFDKKMQRKWWDEGYETAFDSTRLEVFSKKEKLKDNFGFIF